MKTRLAETHKILFQYYLPWVVSCIGVFASPGIFLDGTQARKCVVECKMPVAHVIANALRLLNVLNITGISTKQCRSTNQLQAYDMRHAQKVS